MTEQTRGYNFDDEHSLMDEPAEMQPETSAEEEVLSHQKESVVSRLKASGMLYNIMIGVAVLVAIILFYNMFFSGHSKPAPTQAAPNFGMQLTSTSSTPAPATNLFPASTTQNMQQSVAPVSGQMNSSGDYIMLQKQDLQTMINGFTQVANKDNDALNSEVGKLQATVDSELQNQTASSQQVEALQVQVQQLSTKFDNFNQNLGEIAKDLDATQAQLQLILAQTAQQATQLSLRAVVPGRAWLVDSKGNTTTVTTGDILPYYGKVTNIDADAGKVYMSSGYIFQ